MAKSRFGFGAMAATAVVAYLISQSESAAPGSTRQGIGSVTEVVDATVDGAGTVFNSGLDGVSGAASGVGGAAGGRAPAQQAPAGVVIVTPDGTAVQTTP